MLGSGLVLDSTMTFSVNVASNGGNNFWLSVIEFDDTFPLKSVRLNGVSAGSNTLYTVPAGKVAHIFNGTGLTSFTTPSIACSNDSGAARTVTIYAIPSGGSAGTSNQMTSNASVSNNGVLGITCPGVLNAGDSITITPDATTGTQSYWITVLER